MYQQGNVKTKTNVLFLAGYDFGKVVYYILRLNLRTLAKTSLPPELFVSL